MKTSEKKPMQSTCKPVERPLQDRMLRAGLSDNARIPSGMNKPLPKGVAK